MAAGARGIVNEGPDKVLANYVLVESASVAEEAEEPEKAEKPEHPGIFKRNP